MSRNMKKMAFAVMALSPFVGAQAADNAQVTVTAKVDPVLELTRKDGNNIVDIFDSQKDTATFNVKTNIGQTVAVSIAGEREVEDTGGKGYKIPFDLTSDPNIADDKITLVSNIDGTDFKTKFSAQKAQDRYKAANYTGTITFTAAAS